MKNKRTFKIGNADFKDFEDMTYCKNPRFLKIL